MPNRPRVNIIDLLSEWTVEKMREAMLNPSPRNSAYPAAYGLTAEDTQETGRFRASLREAFGREDRSAVDRVLRAVPMHETLRRSLEKMEIEPRDMIAISLWIDSSVDFELSDTLEYGLYVNREKNESHGNIRFGKDILWEHIDPDGGGSIEMSTPLPESVKPGMAGMPLDQVISHPALDGLGIVIESVEHYEQNDSTILNLSAIPEEKVETGMAERNLRDEIWHETREADHVGRVLRGFHVLMRAGCPEFLLVSEGGPTERLEFRRVTIGFHGIRAYGRLIVPFDRIHAWKGDQGEPCVAWEEEGVRMLIAPGAAVDGPHLREVLSEFVARRREGDGVRVGDLMRTIGDDGNLSIEGGVLAACGERLAIADMTWAQVDEDKDGNAHCHIVMADGRYRHVALMKTRR